jgi:signal transduction histidine kinase
VKVAVLRHRLLERWQTSTRLQDNLTAVATFAVGLALNLVGLTGIWHDIRVADEHLTATAIWWWQTLLLAVGCLAMLGKRRHPMLALGCGAVVVVADFALGGSIAVVLVLFDLLFSVGQFASARARTAVTTAVFVIIGTASVVGGLAVGEFRVAVFIGLQLTTLLFVPLWWAANLRQQRLLGALTAERAAREAVLAERTAVARDLHDAIAAHLSTSAIHSGAVLARAPETERDRAALQAVRTSSLAALEEMRTMILLLRADGSMPDDATMPGGAERLPELVDAAAADGLRVCMDMPEVPRVPAPVGQALYRIVQEALTNAGKHAPGSSVHLEVAEDADHVNVTITNTLTSTVDLGHRALSAGTGLASMRERAMLLGGELSAGRDGDGWRVHLTLPRRPAAEVPPARSTRRRR